MLLLVNHFMFLQLKWKVKSCRKFEDSACFWSNGVYLINHLSL
ncbi:hypothetical protein HanHA89_Chr11g0450621 [Helianthus annuus]|nr:hypothetical protein HanHA89_Chr11g0450621 [Helianthus annuus]